MNAHNTQTNYMATDHTKPSNYVPPPVESESRIDKSYILSLRGIFKIACVLFCFIAFMCLVTTSQCGGIHGFLASITWLVIIVQVIIMIIFVFRLQTKFSGIDFDFLDFFATSHDALYLLIASSLTIHYCPIPGQVAGGVLGLLACASLVGNAVAIFLARREETTPNTNSNGG